MTLVSEFQSARRDEDRARVRRAFALRAMVALGLTQREIAEALGISQPAVSQQLKVAPTGDDLEPDDLLRVAGPVLRAIAEARGYQRLAVFGSVARGASRPDSDVDLLVEAPPGTSSFDFVDFQRLLERVLGRRVDLVSYDALTPTLDDDILREAVLL